MTQKQKKELRGAIIGLVIMLGFYLWYKLSLNIIALLFIIIILITIANVIINSIPSKTTKRGKIQKGKRNPNSTKKKKQYLSDIDLLKADIFTLEGIEFERLCYMYFKDNGFNPDTTPKSGDHGVDLTIKDPKDGLKIAVQCKRWSNKPVGNGDLLKLEAGKKAYKCIGTLCITTSTYTDKAKEYADAVRMDLWNGLTVKSRIEKWQKEKLKKIS